jgi:hypothetical protein
MEGRKGRFVERNARGTSTKERQRDNGSLGPRAGGICRTTTRRRPRVVWSHQTSSESGVGKKHSCAFVADRRKSLMRVPARSLALFGFCVGSWQLLSLSIIVDWWEAGSCCQSLLIGGLSRGPRITARSVSLPLLIATPTFPRLN